MSYLTEKDFKLTIMFTDLKHDFKRKEDMMAMLHKVENTNKEINYLKRSNGNYGVEKYKKWHKNSLKGLKSRLNQQMKKLMNMKIN